MRRAGVGNGSCRANTRKICAAAATPRDIGALPREMRSFRERESSAPAAGTTPAPLTNRKEGAIMLWTLAVILLVLWGVGLVTSYTMGGLIHILLLLAVIAVAIRLIQGRRIT
jgi:Family of unknown function (DUF5670)